MANFGWKEALEHARKAKEEKKGVIRKYTMQNTSRARYLKQIPPKYQGSMYDVFTMGKSLTKAVKMKCLDCTCFSVDDIKHCTVDICPLYDFRPYK